MIALPVLTAVTTAKVTVVTAKVAVVMFSIPTLVFCILAFCTLLVVATVGYIFLRDAIKSYKTCLIDKETSEMVKAINQTNKESLRCIRCGRYESYCSSKDWYCPRCEHEMHPQHFEAEKKMNIFELLFEALVAITIMIIVSPLVIGLSPFIILALLGDIRKHDDEEREEAKKLKEQIKDEFDELKKKNKIKNAVIKKSNTSILNRVLFGD